MGSDRVVVHLPPMPQPKDFGLDAQVKNDTPAAERYDRALKVWDLRAAKRSLSIDTKGFSEMNYVSLSEGNRSATGTSKVIRI